MKENSRFNLETAIAVWRRTLEHQRVFRRADVEELETHVRDHIEVLVAEGYDESAAFDEAMQEVGDFGMAEREYRKVFWEKIKYQGALLRETMWDLAMLKNYVRSAFRNLKQHKLYAGINVLGLALGLASCLLIVLYVYDELRYDHHFPDANRIARIVSEGRAYVQAPLGPALVEDLPGVEQSVRLKRFIDFIVQVDDGPLFTELPLFTDTTFFDLFAVPLKYGSTEKALQAPNSVVLSASTALKFFGDRNPVGELLTVTGGLTSQPTPLVVTAVVEDFPEQTHFRFNMLMPFHFIDATLLPFESWTATWLWNYVRLEEGFTAAALQDHVPHLIEQRSGNPTRTTYAVQPLTDIHLHSGNLQWDISAHGSFTYILIFGAIAMLILGIACINFMNLATARSADRAREVGLRKVLGAHRRQLIQQFLGESLVMVFFALLVAVGLLAVGWSTFQSLTGKMLAFSVLDVGGIVLGLLGVVLLVGLVAGSYPAFFLSAFRPAETLKGKGSARSQSRLRQGLVVVQFCITIALTVGTLIIYNQLDYVQNTRLGFDKEHVVLLPAGNNELTQRHQSITSTFAQLPDVVSVSATRSRPGMLPSGLRYRPEGWTKPNDAFLSWATYFIDAGFVETLGMEVIAGRSFSANIASDTTGFLINRAAWEVLQAEVGDAWSNPVGKHLDYYTVNSGGWYQDMSGPVVGVIEDFHYLSLHNTIEPLVLQIGSQPFHNVLMLRLNSSDMTATLAQLEATWNDLQMNLPFDFFFLDDQLDTLYRTELQLGQLLGGFALLAIFIAGLGLFGLVAFTVERRSKEIGIRKVFGAPVRGIVLLLSKDFLRLIALAYIVASPLAYYALEGWLQSFAYRVDVGIGTFALAGGLALFIAFMTMTYQALKAANANPVETLRYE